MTKVAIPSANHAISREGQAFCLAPFRNLSVAIGGIATPCCEFKGNFGDVKQQSIPEIWNGQAFTEFRRKMLRDEKDDACSKCYDMEATGGLSLRRTYNEHLWQKNSVFAQPDDFLAKTEDSATVQPAAQPLMLDIRFSNLCNFSCRMCHHGASSKWFSDARALKATRAPEALIKTFTSTEASIEAIHPLLPSVEEIYFAGGEPLLIEQHYAILSELVALGRTDVVLYYNTNLSALRLGRHDVVELWSHFKTISLELSVDGADERGELVRKGMDWDVFVANVKTLKQKCPHITLRFGVTVSVFNIAVLPELHERLVELVDHENPEFHLHVLQEPDYYSIQILPEPLKKAIEQRLEAHAELYAADASVREQFQHIAAHMMAADRSALIERFRNITLRLDAMRKESTAVACPELAPLLRFSLRSKLVHLIQRVPSLNRFLSGLSLNRRQSSSIA